MSERAALLSLLTALHGCNGCGCGGGDHVAELVQRDGSVDRDHAASLEQWEAADDGARFAVGDGVRTGERSSARVRLTRGGGIALESETLVRFLRERPGEAAGPGVEILTGAAVLEAGDDGLALDTQIGLARLDPGARVRLEAVEGGLRLDVTIGQASFETAEGTVNVAADDDALTVGIGGAVLEEEEDAGADAGTDAGAALEPAAAGLAIRVEGDGAEVRRPGEEAFQPLAAGTAVVEPGSALRAGGSARIELRRTDGSADVLPPALVDVTGGPLLGVQSGRITARATETVEVRVPGGVVALRPGAEARIEAGGGETRITALSGEVELRGRGRTPEVLTAVATGTIGARGEIGRLQSPPGGADLALGAGDSAVIHDPRPPTHVRIATADCDGTAIVQLSTGRGFRRGDPSWAGTGSVTIAADAGRNRYRVLCDRGGEEGPAEVGQGTLHIQRDAGTRELARGAPRSSVDADGRRWTVLYQNRLPGITFGWRDAPPSGSYTLTVTPSSGAPISQSAPRPSVTFPSGRLPEGSYRFQFATSDGRRSRPTTMRVDFDNAARLVYIREPGEGSIRPGSTVRVSGGALPGSTVRVGGTTLPLDAQLRFSGSVSAPAGLDALVIRVTHPAGGTHLYLRHYASGE